MRSRITRKTFFCLALACCMLLAGCTPALSFPQPTLEELLAETNAAHRTVKQQPVDTAAYMREAGDAETRQQYYDAAGPEYDPARVLTRQQAAEDIAYLFDALYACYAPYDLFGGEAVFGAAEQAVLAELEAKETLTGQELQDLLLAHLDFIQDGHFSINGDPPVPFKLAFFFRETAFGKTEAGYQTADGKTVASVDRHPDLDALFKRSISPEGQLVYYPILLKDGVFFGTEDGLHLCDETLTVYYTDGSTQELTAEPRYDYHDIVYRDTSSRQYGDIPVFQFNVCDTEATDELTAGAAKLKEAPLSILDLRSNVGGSSLPVDAWLEEYAGKAVTTLLYTFDVFTPHMPISYNRDRWVSNENTLLILLGKQTASAGEYLVGCAYNLENVLFIGENTYGCQLSDSTPTYLPNSGCRVTIGSGLLRFTPQDPDCFEELRGFYPDIWAPAAEAEELAVKLMENLRQ